VPKYVTLQPHLTTEELEWRYRSAHEPHERSEWQILWLLSCRQSARQVSQSRGYSPYLIGQLAKRYNTEGPRGMRNCARTDCYRRAPRGVAHRAAGPSTWRTSAVDRTVSGDLDERAPQPPIVAPRGWDYLHLLGQSPHVPRQRHVHADPAAQARFKQSSAHS
jgi:hypothetical protein